MIYSKMGCNKCGEEFSDPFSLLIHVAGCKGKIIRFINEWL